MRHITLKIMAFPLLLLVALVLCVLPLRGKEHDNESSPALACRVEPSQVPLGGAAVDPVLWKSVPKGW